MIVKKLYNWLRHPGDSLSERAVHGGVWVFIIRIFTRGFSLIRTVVLARLLTPNDFGLFGIAMLALQSLKRFSKTGFNQALIQRKEETKSYLDTAWTIQVIRGLVLSGIMIAGAPLVGLFFQEPRAILIVRVLGVAVLLKSFRNIGVVYFKKKLEFHKQFLYQFASVFSDLVVALTTGFILRSVWALIYGLLAKNSAQLIFSYIVHGYRPSIELDWNKAKDLFTFGRWIFAGGILGFLVTQGDDVFLGSFLGASSLGLYQLAYRFSNAPVSEFTKIIKKITFPTFSKLQDNMTKLRIAYNQAWELATFVFLPMSVGIIMLGPNFTKIFLGDKWLPMVPALQILGVSAIMRAVVEMLGSFDRAIGRPRLGFSVLSIRTLILGVLIYPLTAFYGMTGTSLSVLCSLVPLVFIWLYFAHKYIGINYVDILKKLFPQLGGVTLMIITLLLLKYFLVLNYLSFFFSAVSSVLIYLIVPLFYWKKLNSGPIQRLVKFKNEI